MNNLSLTIGLSLFLLSPLCAQAGAKEDFQQTYMDAKSTHNDAGNFQWTTTSSRLEAAESAAENGDYCEAIMIATEALKMAQESVNQRKQQAKDWRKITIGD